MFSSEAEGEPRLSRGWFDPPPLFAVDVYEHDPEQVVIIDSSAMFFPVSLEDIPEGTYRVQAVARRSLDSPNPGRGAGDLYSNTQTVYLKPGADITIRLHLEHVVESVPVEESANIRVVEMISPLMSAFFGRPYIVRAGVSLPQNWSESSETRYPVLYSITGFGGNHRRIAQSAERLGPVRDKIIFVIPDASNYRGHSAFADSDNTGPWGQMLTEELIPYIEENFRGAGAEHRYVTGGSSGGWSSLWLQVMYPEVFNGVWSIVPDPVDFHDFQQIDLYAPNANMYWDEDGNRRPLARRDGEVALWYEDFVHMEDVMGPGGQIHSFEAVFSPKGSDGKPVPLFDRKTGKVDPDVAQYWTRYDIRHILETNWDDLKPRLEGKLRIYAGAIDNFYLEGAVRLLGNSLEKLGSDADVRIFEGVGHQMPPGVLEEMLDFIITHYDAGK